MQIKGSNEAKTTSSDNAPQNSTEVSNKDDFKEEVSVAEQSILQKIFRKGLIESTKPLEIQRKNEKSPLYSVKSFEHLHL